MKCPQQQQNGLGRGGGRRGDATIYSSDVSRCFVARSGGRSSGGAHVGVAWLTPRDKAGGGAWGAGGALGKGAVRLLNRVPHPPRAGGGTTRRPRPALCLYHSRGGASSTRWCGASRGIICLLTAVRRARGASPPACGTSQGGGLATGCPLLRCCTFVDTAEDSSREGGAVASFDPPPPQRRESRDTIFLVFFRVVGC